MPGIMPMPTDIMPRKVTSEPSRESQPETRLGLGDSAVKFERLAAPDASRNDSVNSIRLELSAFSLSLFFKFFYWAFF